MAPHNPYPSWDGKRCHRGAGVCPWRSSQPTNPCALSSHREVILGRGIILYHLVYLDGEGGRRDAEWRRRPIPPQASQEAKACSKQLASEVYSTRSTCCRRKQWVVREIVECNRVERYRVVHPPRSLRTRSAQGSANMGGSHLHLSRGRLPWKRFPSTSSCSPESVRLLARTVLVGLREVQPRHRQARRVTSEPISADK